MTTPPEAAGGRAAGDAAGDAGGDDVALLTISYAGDLPMCRRLCESVDRHMPDVRHYLAVDRVDRALFEPLASGNRVLLTTEDFVPAVLQTRLMGRRVWLTPYGPPLRGWIYQQFVKLAVVASLACKVVVIVDSDAVFVRPLDPGRLLREGRARLWRAPGQGAIPEHAPWFRVAGRVLGLPPRDYYGAEFITTGVTWSPEVARALLARIRRVTRLPWQVALSWRFRISEYLLYGVFAEHVPGPHRDRVFFDERDLCHCSWHYDLAEAAGRAAFLDGLAPDQALVLIQSNLGMAEPERARLLATFETGTAA